MLLNALTNYLQNQPSPAELKNTANEAITNVSKTDAEKASTDTGPALYEVSHRAVMVSAVAAEFNINALEPAQLDSFQNRLQEFGLIDRVGIGALSLVHAARRESAEEENPTNTHSNNSKVINAKAIIDQAFEESSQPGTTYSQRQQINQLHTLFSNIDSARPH